MAGVVLLTDRTVHTCDVKVDGRPVIRATFLQQLLCCIGIGEDDMVMVDGFVGDGCSREKK